MDSMEINKQPRRSFPIQQEKDKLAENWGRRDVGEGILTSQLNYSCETVIKPVAYWQVTVSSGSLAFTRLEKPDPIQTSCC